LLKIFAGGIIVLGVANMKDNRKPNWDRPYKIIFSNPEIVKELITKYFDSDWVRDVDFSTLQKLPTEIIGEELDETRDDVIWQVNFRDTKLYIVLLIEFQSTSDAFMSARILSYIGNLYLEIIRTEKITSNQKLPPVFPLVVYNGQEAWKAAKSFKEIVYCPYKSLNKYIPDVFYELFEEREVFKKISDPQLLIDLLVSIEFCNDPDSMKKLVSQLCDLADKSPSVNQLLRGFRLLIKKGLLRSSKHTKELCFDWDDTSSPQEAKNMLEQTMKKWADNYYTEGIEKGVKKGDKKAKEQVAVRLINKGLSCEEISEVTDLTIDQVQRLAQQIKNKLCEPNTSYK
jgi:predicted transposase/invertase (TIGR01784 family)